MKIQNLHIKKASITFLSLAILLGTVSCREDIVELSPYTSVGEVDAFSTPSLINLSVNGVYNAAQIGYFNGAGARGYVFGAAYFQQNEVRGEDVVNTQAFYQITYEANYDPTTANNVYYWADAYKLINRANLVKEGIEKAVTNGVISQAEANPQLGEVLFFRAIAHQELLKHFARPYHLDAGASLGVPYRTFGVSTVETVNTSLQQGRNTVADCYTKLLADLDAAEQLLPTKLQRPAGIDRISRATKGAAIAFKMRAYMSMRNWNAVLTEYAKLTSQYSIETEYNKVFTSNLSNNESIFSLNNTATNNPGVNGALPSQFNGRSLVAISPILWRNSQWLATDKRRLETEVVNGAVYTRKYKDITNYTDSSPLARMADMTLLAAEANARIGGANTATALTLLNSVRNRALANPTTEAYTAATFPTQAALVNAIITERRIELSFEGQRWGDIHRLINDDLAPTSGIPAKVPNGFPAASAYVLGTPYSGVTSAAIPYTDKRFLWPLPTIETNNNPTLAAQQNPGY